MDLKNFLGYESPLMAVLNKVADLILLNFVTILGCIPIVTACASLTACYYTALKIKRGEGYVLSNFWSSFKVNLVESTILFFLFLFFGGVFLWLWRFLSLSETGTFLKGFYFMIICLCFATLVWLFPMQSRFDNNIFVTIGKSVIISIRYIFRTIVMAIMWGAWGYLVIKFPIKMVPAILFFGISLPVYLCVKMYNKKFEMIEEVLNTQN